MIEELETATYDFDINAGATLVRYITMYLPKGLLTDPNVPFPFTGFIGRAQIRRNATATTAYDITVELQAAGLMKLSMVDELTATIPCGLLKTDTRSRYVWALELAHVSGYVLRPLEGTVRISAEVVK